MTGRERFSAALKGQRLDRAPVFPLLMFLAADRAGITYRQFATDGRALADAQLGAQRRFGFEAITACSDAFRVSAALGGEMAFPEDKPPYLAKPLIKSASDLKKLGRPDPTDRENRMGDRVLGVAEMARSSGDGCAVLGWVDMPFAEACAVCGLTPFMMMLVDDPSGAHRILDFLTRIVVDFSLAQLRAGAVMIGAGDAAASLISAEMYDEFALPYEREVCRAAHEAGGLVKLHVCGNTTHLLEKMATCGADLFNVDHMVPLEKARDVYGAARKCFKGNMDPVADMMRSTPEQCEKRAHRCLSIAQGAAYMLSPGCEVPAATSDEVFRAFCNAPQTFQATE